MNQSFHRRYALSVGGLLLLAGAPTARAEEVTLVDSTRILGKLIHYFDGEVTIETTNDLVPGEVTLEWSHRRGGIDIGHGSSPIAGEADSARA